MSADKIQKKTIWNSTCRLKIQKTTKLKLNGSIWKQTETKIARFKLKYNQYNVLTWNVISQFKTQCFNLNLSNDMQIFGKLMNQPFDINFLWSPGLKNISEMHFNCLWIYAVPERRSHKRFSVKRGVRRNFAKFTRKHLCQSLFF